MQSHGSGYGLGSGDTSRTGGSLSGSMHGLGDGVARQPWMNQAQQLQRKLNGGDGLSRGGDPGGPSSLSSGAGKAMANPYGGMPSAPGVGGPVPGASSPYTSTGNAAGNSPYRDPYALNQLETAGVK